MNKKTISNKGCYNCECWISSVQECTNPLSPIHDIAIKETYCPEWRRGWIIDQCRMIPCKDCCIENECEFKKEIES